MQIPKGPASSVGFREGARSVGTAREVFDETSRPRQRQSGRKADRPDPAGLGGAPRRNLGDEDARQIMHNVTGFFGVLVEWARAERREAANDAGAPTAANNEVRHDR